MQNMYRIYSSVTRTVPGTHSLLANDAVLLLIAWNKTELLQVYLCLTLV